MASLQSDVPEVVSSTHPTGSEKMSDKDGHVECVSASGENPEYDNVDEEPELHIQTYIALAAMFLLNMVQVLALQGPPAIVRPFSRPIYRLITDSIWHSSRISDKILKIRKHKLGYQIPCPSFRPFCLPSLLLRQTPSRLVNTFWLDLPRCRLLALLLLQVQKASTA
jgi:hypothetical protein